MKGISAFIPMLPTWTKFPLGWYWSYGITRTLYVIRQLRCMKYDTRRSSITHDIRRLFISYFLIAANNEHKLKPYTRNGSSGCDPHDWTWSITKKRPSIVHLIAFSSRQVGKTKSILHVSRGMGKCPTGLRPTTLLILFTQLISMVKTNRTHTSRVGCTGVGRRVSKSTTRENNTRGSFTRTKAVQHQQNHARSELQKIK